MRYLIVLFFASISLSTSAQQYADTNKYSHADTLRGAVTPERAWWDVLHYDLSVTPQYKTKTITGKNIIRYKVIEANGKTKMQIDLQEPLQIVKILLDNTKALTFKKEGNIWRVAVPPQLINSTHTVAITYKGVVHEAKNAPWDGGWLWSKDSLGRPWMTVACQGIGGSIWYPCKDHQSDEPDMGANLTMTVPDALVAIGNGRLKSKKKNPNGTTTWQYAVVNPISNYCIIPYIGKYVNFKEVYDGEKGKLDLNYWVLDYNLEKAKSYMPPEVHNMMKALEFWFGPYPFYEDGYQLIDAPHTGMEHQSAVAYGNWYRPGYRDRDQSGVGWGKKFDFIIEHESGHEWFGNNITTKDLADMWVHEGFTNYSETLFVDYIFGKDAGNQYNFGIRKGIQNDKPIIPAYNVNAKGSGDMYPKSGNMLHSIRHGLNNDTLFRSVLRGLNQTFYHKTVTSQEVEDYISEKVGFDYSNVFNQYLRTKQIPVFEYIIAPDSSSVKLRYRNCLPGFNLPLYLDDGKNSKRIIPTSKFVNVAITKEQAALFTPALIEAMYYVKVLEINTNG